MKTDHYFAPFLNKYGYLDIYGIGHFELSKDSSTDFSAVEAIKKSFGQKNKRVHFNYFTNAAIDEKLVEFLHEETYGDYNVIHCNLKSYTELTYEMLKLGFEVEVPGLGHLRLSNASQQVVFSPYGQSSHNAMHLGKTPDPMVAGEEDTRNQLSSFSFNRIMKKITDYIS
jgi:hypothetical protein